MTEALVPHNVAFYGDEIIAVQQHDGAIYILFSHMCDNIGRPRVTETRRVQQHAVLSTGLIELTIQTAGGRQSVLCLRLDLLPLWLASIPSKRLKPAVKDKVIRYQTEAAFVLWETFKPQIIVEETTITSAADDLALQQLQYIAEMGRAITHMAEQQMELQRQQQALTTRMDTAARVIKGLQGEISDIQVRLGVVEDRLHPSAYITEEQATEVSNLVKALAELLTSQDAKKNHYQSVFAELYRRFGVPSYKHIRQEQYAAVLAFLDDWRTAAARMSETNSAEGP